MNVLIIGGGAAGYFAAITCAEANPSAKVTILEKSPDVLKKVKVSGGGRCNVTHACFDPRDLVRNYPRGQKELLGPFTRFQPADMIEWLENRGVSLKAGDDGRMFPVTDDSQSIIDCFMKTAARSGIKCLTRKNVVKIETGSQGNQLWVVKTQDGHIYYADKLMICGGSSLRLWELLQELGHSIIKPVPSLFTFNIRDNRIKSLPGLSVPDAALSIPSAKLSSFGPLLITHWGLSGPAILKLSAWGARFLADINYKFELEVSWSGSGREQVLELLLQNKDSLARKYVETANTFGLPNRLWKNLIDAAGISQDTKWADLSKTKLENLSLEIAGGIYTVQGKSTFKEEFVTAGGVALEEIDFRTFGSRICPNLFLAGEILDIDAITGGFNFQAAWTGAYLAGKAMALG